MCLPIISTFPIISTVYLHRLSPPFCLSPPFISTDYLLIPFTNRDDLLHPSCLPPIISLFSTISLSAKVEIIFFKYLLFLLVILPPPSTFTKYWS